MNLPLYLSLSFNLSLCLSMSPLCGSLFLLWIWAWKQFKLLNMSLWLLPPRCLSLTLFLHLYLNLKVDAHTCFSACVCYSWSILSINMSLSVCSSLSTTHISYFLHQPCFYFLLYSPSSAELQFQLVFSYPPHKSLPALRTFGKRSSYPLAAQSASLCWALQALHLH